MGEQNKNTGTPHISHLSTFRGHRSGLSPSGCPRVPCIPAHAPTPRSYPYFRQLTLLAVCSPVSWDAIPQTSPATGSISSGAQERAMLGK